MQGFIQAFLMCGKWLSSFKQVYFEKKKKKKCLHVACFLQLGALYATITHDPRSEYNWQKSQQMSTELEGLGVF